MSITDECIKLDQGKVTPLSLHLKWTSLPLMVSWGQRFTNVTSRQVRCNKLSEFKCYKTNQRAEIPHCKNTGRFHTFACIRTDKISRSFWSDFYRNAFRHIRSNCTKAIRTVHKKITLRHGFGMVKLLHSLSVNCFMVLEWLNCFTV